MQSAYRSFSFLKYEYTKDHDRKGYGTLDSMFDKSSTTISQNEKCVEISKLILNTKKSYTSASFAEFETTIKVYEHVVLRRLVGRYMRGETNGETHSIARVIRNLEFRPMRESICSLAALTEADRDSFNFVDTILSGKMVDSRLVSSLMNIYRETLCTDKKKEGQHTLQK
jgi:hypothetical protein